MPSHKRLTFHEEYMMKLELESITKFYGKYPALQNVSATLTEGVYGLLGPNGAGKTTLINILIGILPASSGVIHLDGENTVQMGGRYFDQIGYMPQYLSLIHIFGHRRGGAAVCGGWAGGIRRPPL